MVTMMAEDLEFEVGYRVDVGAGSGYNVAVLADVVVPEGGV